MHAKLGLLRGLSDLVLGGERVDTSVLYADLLHHQLVGLVRQVLDDIVAG